MSASLDASKRIEGTAQDGTYQATITLPHYSEKGTWRIGQSNTVYLVDAAGNSKNYVAPELSDAVAEDGGVFDFSGSANGFKGCLAGTALAKPIGSVATFRRLSTEASRSNATSPKRRRNRSRRRFGAQTLRPRRPEPQASTAAWAWPSSRAAQLTMRALSAAEIIAAP